MPSSGGFSISITAVDSASRVFDGVNKRLSTLSAPAERFNKALTKFGDTSGLSRVSEGVSTLGRGAADAFRSLDRMASPLAAITSAGSIAGVVELSRRWAEFGNQLGQVAYRLNTPVEKLSSLRGAMRLAGGSAADLDAGLGGLDAKLRGAAFGRDAGAVQLLTQLHVGFKNVDGSARTAEDALGDVAESIKGMNPGAQGHVLDELGLGQSFLPLLKGGRKGLEDFRKQADATGGGMTKEMVEHATEMNKAWQALGLTVEGVGNRIVDSWSGTITKVLEGTTHWIENNKNLADSIAEVGTGIGLIAALKPAAWVLRLLGLGAVADVAVPVAAGAAVAAGGADIIQHPFGNVATQEQEDAITGHSPTGRPGSLPGGGFEDWWRRSKPSASVTLDPTKRGFLDTIAGPESHGEYNIKNGGSHFDDYSKFPEGVGPRGTSTASGRYQFISGTWRSVSKSLGLNDFSPESQDKGAWYLAETAYRAKTGGDLEADLKSGNNEMKISNALGSIWPSLPGGSQSHQSIDTFDRSLAQNTATEQGRVHVEVTVKDGRTTSAKTTVAGPVTTAPPRIETPMPLVH